MTNVEELFFQACEKWNEGNLGEAYTKFELAAKQGHASSQNNLGIFFECGHFVERDFEKAIFWYKKSADQEDVASFSNLAGLYLKMGKVDDAVAWYKKAIKLGDGDAMLELAKIYMLEDYSDKDISKSKLYLERAIQSNSITPDSLKKAKNMISRLEYN